VLQTGRIIVGGRAMEEPFGLNDYSDNEPVRSVDVVCGATVDEETAPAKTSYAGQTFYFCSKECQRNFELEPQSYLPRAAAGGAKTFRG
jgi:YHS domain-containing protein